MSTIKSRRIFVPSELKLIPWGKQPGGVLVVDCSGSAGRADLAIALASRGDDRSVMLPVTGKAPFHRRLMPSESYGRQDRIIVVADSFHIAPEFLSVTNSDPKPGDLIISDEGPYVLLNEKDSWGDMDSVVSLTEFESTHRHTLTSPVVFRSWSICYVDSDQRLVEFFRREAPGE